MTRFKNLIGNYWVNVIIIFAMAIGTMTVASAALYYIDKTKITVNGIPAGLTVKERAKLIEIKTQSLSETLCAPQCDQLNKAAAKAKIKAIILAETPPVVVPPVVVPPPVLPPVSTPPTSGGGIVQVGDMPAVDTSKNITPAAGYNSFRIQPTTEQSPQGSDGAFRIGCKASHMSNDDPMVFPNQQGATHHHTFYGNTSVNYKSDLNNLASVGNSTCNGGTMNRSAYWHPTMIDTTTNAPVLSDGARALFYYKTGNVVSTAIKPPPKGLRILAGNPRATTESQAEDAAVRYICEGSPAPGSADTDVKDGWITYIPNCRVGQTMQMVIEFPQCWDGKNLDSPNHRDHMAYPNGQTANRCPASHPVAIPAIALNMNFTITQHNQAARWRLASDNYAKSLPGGYSSHADWVNGWDEPTLAGIVRNCLNANRDGHAHLLCDGRAFY